MQTLFFPNFLGKFALRGGGWGKEAVEATDGMSEKGTHSEVFRKNLEVSRIIYRENVL